LNLSIQSQAIWMEILGNTSPGPVPDPWTKPPGDTFGSASKPGFVRGVSLSAFDILRGRLPPTTPYIEYQRAVLPVYDRQCFQLECLRQSYYRKYI